MASTVLPGKDKDVVRIDPGVPRNAFEDMTETLFEDMLELRQGVIEAQQKIRNVDNSSILRRYPNLSMSQLTDLRGQFQTFDLNQDGLIDYKELCMVLNELGDSSDDETRRQYFAELDEDGSGAVDFEEYLALINRVMGGSHHTHTLSSFCKQGSENANKLRKMSIMQQIDTGLF